MSMDRRQELSSWIAQTRRLQRKMAYGFGVALVVCIGVIVWHGTIGTLVTISVVGTAIAAFWITAAHNASHRQKLDELAAAERRKHMPPAPATGGHRRWAQRQAE